MDKEGQNEELTTSDMEKIDGSFPENFNII